MEKPISVRIRELKEGIANLFNNCGLPAWVILYVLDPFYSQLGQLKDLQDAEEEKMYQKSLKEGNNDD